MCLKVCIMHLSLQNHSSDSLKDYHAQRVHSFHMWNLVCSVTCCHRFIKCIYLSGYTKEWLLLWCFYCTAPLLPIWFVLHGTAHVPHTFSENSRKLIARFLHSELDPDYVLGYSSCMWKAPKWIAISLYLFLFNSTIKWGVRLYFFQKNLCNLSLSVNMFMFLFHTNFQMRAGHL